MQSTKGLNRFGKSKKKSYIYHMKLVGELHPMHKLTEVQVTQIRELWKVGHRNIKVLARNNGVSQANIKKIVTNKTWTHMLKWPYERV
jgi:hypothetical protein